MGCRYNADDEQLSIKNIDPINERKTERRQSNGAVVLKLGVIGAYSGDHRAIYNCLSVTQRPVLDYCYQDACAKQQRPVLS